MEEAASSVSNVPSSPSKVEDDASWSGGGWWNSVVSTIKATAEKVVEVYKEDLQEFAGNITHDTEQVIEDVKHSEIVEKALAAAANYDGANILNTVVDAISDEKSNNNVTPATRLEAKILELQKDIGTYCTSPSEAKLFEAFCKEFSSKDEEKVRNVLVYLF